IILKGKGISIHSRECPNIQKIIENEPERIITAVWNKSNLKPVFPAYIRVISEDKPGLLAEMSAAIASTKTNISSAKIRTRRDGKAVNDFRVNVKDLEHLNKIISNLRKVKGVDSVGRICMKK
ncbi:MAG: bifunctional (p)ppGpp synthetase/guanosine-3',5'-bis(diphosphate) 3'-pyrophosphohydrolase, partial [Aquificota bacterium]